MEGYESAFPTKVILFEIGVAFLKGLIIIYIDYPLDLKKFPYFHLELLLLINHNENYMIKIISIESDLFNTSP